MLAAMPVITPGYRGRTAIHELLDLSDNIREMIVERRPGSEVRRAAEAEGLKSLRDSALHKVFSGVFDLARNQPRHVCRRTQRGIKLQLRKKQDLSIKRLIGNQKKSACKEIGRFDLAS
jgi:hypothetical protein